MSALSIDPASAVAVISRIDAVPTILEVICRTTGMGFAAVARVTEDQWIACGVRDDIAFGLQPGGELQIETTICNEIREHRHVVIIDDVSADPVFASHHTPALYGLQSYISMPIILADGTFFGTLCAIDRVPRKLNTIETAGMFKLFANLIAFHLDAYQRISAAKIELETERSETELREQFIAVLGHDLRNPLAAIGAGARVLSRTHLDEKAIFVVTQMQNSVARMSGIIDNVLDFARGRLGGGIPIRRADETAIAATLEAVVAELRATNPDRQITVSIDKVSIVCDPSRLGQLLSNLIANAITYGSGDGPISVKAGLSDGVFELSVGNSGNRIDPAILPHLFKPFVRSAAHRNQQGLGLGLYIAAEVARAHDGSLAVDSTSEETRFTFRMPAG